MTAVSESKVPLAVLPKTSPRRALRKRKYETEPEYNFRAQKLTNNARLSLVSNRTERKGEAVSGLSDEESSDLTEVEDTDAEISDSTKALIHSVYKDVWRDFHGWEHRYCHKILQFLEAELTIGVSQAADNDKDLTFKFDTWNGSRTLFTFESIQVIEHNSREPAESMRISYMLTAPAFEPLESYESCSPTNRSIFVGDDSDELPFLPFADDPGFSVMTYCDQFAAFAWEKADNMEMIALEAVSRLHFYHDVSLAEIGHTHLFPMSNKGSPYIEGFLSQLHLRDLLHWTVSGPEYDDIPLAMTVPDASDIGLRFQNSSNIFCSSLSCIQPDCYVHVDTPKEYIPEVPKLVSADFFSDGKISCGQYCFKDTSGSLPLEEVNDVELEKLLRVVLSVTPDLTPCELAVACRQSCKAVYAMRMKILPDSEIIEGNTHEKSLFRSTNHSARETKQDGIAEPCSHDGPCSSTKDCACFRNKTGCQRRCRCTSKCPRRRQGCSCRSNKRIDKYVCNTMRCPCYRAGIECDLDLCGPCKPRDRSKNLCQNAQIQQGRHKGVAVKKGVAGLGLFITEYARAGDLIAEYTGHLIYDLTCLSREDVSVHVGRNYLFGLNTLLACDGNIVGNETRFINHIDLKKANLLPSVKLVNEEHRIGVYTARALRPGAELLFDYGPSFFYEISSALGHGR